MAKMPNNLLVLCLSLLITRCYAQQVDSQVDTSGAGGTAIVNDQSKAVDSNASQPVDQASSTRNAAATTPVANPTEPKVEEHKEEAVIDSGASNPADQASLAGDAGTATPVANPTEPQVEEHKEEAAVPAAQPAADQKEQNAQAIVAELQAASAQLSEAKPAIEAPKVPEQKVEAPKPDVSKPMESQPVEQRKQPELKHEQDAAHHDDEVYGLDTVDLEDPQGNWLYKRVWWERAEAKYEKIHSTVTKLMESKTGFFAKRSELDKSVLDPFYLSIGMGQGELLEMVSQLIENIKKQELEKKKNNKMTEEDEELLEKVQAEKKDLEGLHKQVQKVIHLDQAVDDAIMTLVEQMNRLRSYDQQAWKDFKNIARVLDDKKARELYYKVDGAWRNVQEIQQYLESPYASGFDSFSEQVKQEVAKINTAIEELKARGIDLKKQVVQEESADQNAEEQEDQDEAQEQAGFFRRYIINPFIAFFSTIGKGIKAVWDFIVSIVMWPINKIFNRTAPEDALAEGGEDQADADQTDEQESSVTTQSVPKEAKKDDAAARIQQEQKAMQDRARQAAAPKPVMSAPASVAPVASRFAESTHEESDHEKNEHDETKDEPLEVEDASEEHSGNQINLDEPNEPVIDELADMDSSEGDEDSESSSTESSD